MEEEERSLSDYSLIELGEYADILFERGRNIEDRESKKIIKKKYKEVALAYNKRSNFEAYKTII